MTMMTKNPRVSVVIPNYNYARYVTQAVDSILAQSLSPGDLEVIVVDDASTDSSWEVLQRYRGDSRVTILRHGENSGIATSWNDGMAAARGRYIACLDADDFALDPAALAIEARMLDHDPTAALVTVDHVIVDDKGRRLGYKRARVPARMEFRDAFRKLLRENFITHSGVMIRASCIAELGGYDPRFVFNQDYELWLRLTSKWATLHFPRPLFAYRFHRDSMFFRTVDARFALDARRQILRRAAEYSPLSDTDRVITSSVARAHLTVAAMLFARGERRQGLGNIWSALRLSPRDLVSRSGARALGLAVSTGVLGARAGRIALEVRRRLYSRE